MKSAIRLIIFQFLKTCSRTQKEGQAASGNDLHGSKSHQVCGSDGNDGHLSNVAIQGDTHLNDRGCDPSTPTHHGFQGKAGSSHCNYHVEATSSTLSTFVQWSL